MEKSKSRPFLISASAIDFVCVAVYFIVAVLCIVIGLAAMAGAGDAPADTTEGGETLGAAIAQSFGVFFGTIIVIIGVLCFIAAAVALISVITGVVKINKPISVLKKSTTTIKVSYIFNFIAAAIFIIAGCVALAKGDGDITLMLAPFFVCLVIAALRITPAVLKIKACSIIAKEQDVQQESLSIFDTNEVGSAENHNNEG